MILTPSQVKEIGKKSTFSNVLQGGVKSAGQQGFEPQASAATRDISGESIY